MTDIQGIFYTANSGGQKNQSPEMPKPDEISQSEKNIMRPLNEIPYVEQPKGSRYCGVASIKMINQFYNGDDESFEQIWGKISDESPKGGKYCKTNKMGSYLINKNYYATIVKFKNLKLLLEACKEKRIAAILNHYSLRDCSLGHNTVFLGINGSLVTIHDPEIKGNCEITLQELEALFKSKATSDEITGNIVIIVSKKCADICPSVQNPVCGNCQSGLDITLLKYLFPDNQLPNIIEGIVCTNCNAELILQRSD